MAYTREQKYRYATEIQSAASALAKAYRNFIALTDAARVRTLGDGGAQAIVDAVAHYDEPDKICAASEGLGKPMDSLDVGALKPEERFSKRGN